MSDIQENQKHVAIDTQLKRHWRNKKRIRLLLGLIILLLIVAGFFYWYEKIAQQTAERLQNEGRVTEEERAAKVPVLFGREDYQLQQKTDGQYIVIDRVGFSAKVPAGWKVEFETSSHASVNQEECTVSLQSPDTDAIKSSNLKNGCAITISAGFNPEVNSATKEKINRLSSTSTNYDDLLDKKIAYSIIDISGNKILHSAIIETYGQGVGIKIPIKEKENIDIYSFFPKAEKEKCAQVWDEFIKNITLK